jgi:hypothetical protein
VLIDCKLYSLASPTNGTLATMATSIETDLLEEFQLFFYNGDGLELLHTSLVLISLHSMRKSSDSSVMIIIQLSTHVNVWV